MPTYQIQAAVAGAGPFALGESPVVGYSLVDGATPLASFAVSPTTGITSYLWEIWSTAGGVAAVLSSTTAAAPTFALQADTAGTYLVRCTINGVSVAYIGVSVTTRSMALRIPAPGERLEFGADGWATAHNALYPAVQNAARKFVFRGGTWTCVAGASDYDVTWSADIVIEDPETGEAITISAATLAAVPEGDVLYVTPSTDPITTETLTMAHAATIPSGAIPLAFVLAGAVYVRPMWGSSGIVSFAFLSRLSTQVTTGSVAAGGGTTTGYVTTGCTRGSVEIFRVQAASASRFTRIEWFTDAALTDRVYFADQRDCYASPYHVDRTSWSVYSLESDLADGGRLYYQITNQDLSTASVYTIELAGVGRN